MRSGLALAALALAACTLEPVRDSGEISTRDLHINLDASDAGTGATVRIVLNGPLGNVRLNGGDTLRVSMAGGALPLRETQEDGGTAYLADPAALTGDLSLDLERPHDRNALGVVAAVPPGFTLTAAGLTAGEPLALAWEPAPGDHTLSLSITGDCIVPIHRDLQNDVGAYSIGQEELFHSDPGAPATCPLRVKLTRSETTQRPLLPGIEGGSLYAQAVQEREIEVAWTP